MTRRRRTYVPVDASRSVEARVVLTLSCLAVVLAGAVWAFVAAVGSHILRSL